MLIAHARSPKSSTGIYWLLPGKYNYRSVNQLDLHSLKVNDFTQPDKHYTEVPSNVVNESARGKLNQIRERARVRIIYVRLILIINTMATAIDQESEAGLDI